MIVDPQHAPATRRFGRRVLASIVGAVVTAATLQQPGSQALTDDEQTPGEAYASMGYGVFMHYGLATYVGRTPWAYDPNDVEPTVYDPPSLDTDQWMDAIAASGASYVILTAKHHDGFTLWPSQYTDYGVHNSSDPDTDVVGEVVESARERGLKIVLYYSWFDKLQPGGNVNPRNPNSDRTTNNPEYMAYVKNQLRELLTNYGHIEGIWLDIAPMDDVQLPELADFVHTVSPGTALVPNFPNAIRDAHEAADVATFEGPMEIMPCDFAGKPAEQAFTVAAGPGWWQASDTAAPTRDTGAVMEVMSSTQLLGATLSLNVSPGPSGRIPAASVRLLEAIGDRTRGDDLLADATTSASGESDGNPAAAATDLLTKTQWQIPGDNAWLQVDLDQPMTINRTTVQFSGPDAVSGYTVQFQAANGRWRTVHTGTSPAYPSQTDEFEPVTTSRIRLVVGEAADGAGVIEFKAYGGVDDTADSITFEGTWQALAADLPHAASHVPWDGAFNNTVHRSLHAGDTAAFTFTGDGARLHMSTGPRQGSALVSVDGAQPERVDLTSAEPRSDQAVFEQRGLDDGDHTLTVEVASPRQWVTVDRVIPLTGPVPGLGEPYEELPDGRLIFDDRSSRCDPDSPVIYTGDWSSSAWDGSYRSTRHYSKTPGAFAEFSFTGSGAEVLTQTRPGHGIAAVSIDGGEPELVDTYSNPPREQVTVWEVSGLPPGNHTVRIEVTGDSNPAASNTWVAVDAFIVTP